MTRFQNFVVFTVTSILGNFPSNNSHSQQNENGVYTLESHKHSTCPNIRDFFQIISIPPQHVTEEEDFIEKENAILTNFSKTIRYESVMKNVYTCVSELDEIEKKESELDVKERDQISKLIFEREWTKNFASFDCGAKLVKNSQHVKHASHLINKNQDEYMITECGTESSFVVELCENIKIVRLEIDNFELYSGSPKNFSVYTMDKFSSNHDDWHFLGSFEASEEKMRVQEFHNLDLRSFGRYIRVLIHSYHGTEHFCTLTTFRVFGVTEYEFLSLVDEESHEEQNDDEDNPEDELVISAVESRLNEIAITKASQPEQVSAEVRSNDQTTFLTYRHMVLQMRNDMCVDSVSLESLDTADKRIESIKYASVEISKNASDNEIEAIRKVVNETKVNVSAANPPKESVLVQISNKVKTLEKNITLHNNLLKSLNNTNKQQSNDIDKILETILKAKEVFEDSVKETDGVKTKVNALNSKVTQVEKALDESMDVMKKFMVSTILLGILCAFLTTILCCSQQQSIESVDNEEEIEESITEANPVKNVNSEALEETSENNTSSTEVCEIKKPKKVTFAATDESDKIDRGSSSDDDISRRLAMRRRSTRRQDPRRRSTWCGGSFRKLTEEAANLIAKEF